MTPDNYARTQLRTHAILAEIARNDFDILAQPVELLVLRQLWDAWRSARAETKRAPTNL